jgi:hypothetical protein
VQRRCRYDSAFFILTLQALFEIKSKSKRGRGIVLKEENISMFKIIIAVSLISSYSFAQNMKAGLWRAKTVIALNGIPLPSSENEDCISKELAKDPKQTITKELSKRGCTLSKWTLKGKNLEAAVKCDKDDLEAEGTLAGTVTEKSYELKGDAEGSYKGIPSFANLTLTGTWTKTCKN